jgi:hypothetical protein
MAPQPPTHTYTHWHVYDWQIHAIEASGLCHKLEFIKLASRQLDDGSYRLMGSLSDVERGSVELRSARWDIRRSRSSTAEAEDSVVYKGLEGVQVNDG